MNNTLMKEMKITLVTAIAISAALLSLFAIGNAAKADIRDAERGIITTQPYIISPTNTTYNSRLLALNVSFHAPIYGNDYYSMTYSLDGSENKTLPVNLHYFGFFLQNESYIDGSVYLPELSETSHDITVYLKLEQLVFVNNQMHNKTYLDSQTEFFNIMGSSPNPSSTELKMYLAAAVVVFAVAVVISGLFVYRKKRKREVQ